LHICFKMEKKIKKSLKKEIIIPEGITTRLEKGKIIMKNSENEIEKKIESSIEAKIDADKIILISKKTTRNEKRVIGTTEAHILNMIKGLNEGFKYKLQVAAVHFPVTLQIDKEKNEIVVKNFLGEKTDRRIKILNNVEVKINRDIIELNSFDIEKAGQLAANIEKKTKIRKRDRRVFQDGIFIIEKPGRSFI
jgi:large subunit ribosomal protein L6